jgi:tRNA U34 5-methylaminomethyl-2-thiouridine-forming methyltransferase MnmC
MNKNIEIRTTKDGSKTIYLPDFDENYHSFHGAIQEANHVFIKNGLDFLMHRDSISIFEMGFGTGLNAFLSYLRSKDSNQVIQYVGLEAYPLDKHIYSEMAYSRQLGLASEQFYFDLMDAEWGQFIDVSENFQLLKIKSSIEEWESDQKFDLIYFDAFGPRVQTEMWNLEIMVKMFKLLKTNGVLVTYCAQGQFKRNLKEAGFEVNSLPGPPGKREMTRAIKINKNFTTN